MCHEGRTYADFDINEKRETERKKKKVKLLHHNVIIDRQSNKSVRD